MLEKSGLVALLALALAGPAHAGLNDPFGPEMACVGALKNSLGVESLQSHRISGVTAKELPVSVLDTEGPSFPLETVAKDGKTTHLRIFTETGEFEADVPMPTNTEAACLEGVGFPTGTGSALYNNVGFETPKSRSGTVTNYRTDICPKGKDRMPPVQAHQVGESAQAASRARLTSELGIMIGNSFSTWKERVAFAAREVKQPYYRYGKPRTVHLNVTKLAEDTKGALSKCVEVLQGDSFKAIRAAATRELGLFETQEVKVLGTDSTAHPPK